MSKGRQTAAHRNRRLTKGEKVNLLSVVKNKLTQDEIDYINAAINRRMDAVRVQAFQDAMKQFASINFMVLQDKFGFDVDGLMELWRYYASYTDDINSGRIKLKDISEVLNDESGIRFTFDG